MSPPLRSNPVYRALLAVCDEFGVEWSIGGAKEDPSLVVQAFGQEIGYKLNKFDADAAASDLRNSLEALTAPPAPIVSAPPDVSAPLDQTTAPSIQPMSSAPLCYNGNNIERRGDMLSLTDMWKAGGSSESKRVVDWLRTQPAKEFIDFLALTHNVVPDHLIISKPGKGGGTFGHWQIGLAYAKYLSHGFHVWCNTVVRDHMERGGRPPVRQPELPLITVPAAIHGDHLPARDGWFKPLLGAIKGIIQKNVAEPSEEHIRVLQGDLLERDRKFCQYVADKVQPLVDRIAVLESKLNGANPAMLGVATGEWVDIVEVYLLAQLNLDSIPERASLAGNVKRSLDAYCRSRNLGLGSISIRGGTVDAWPIRGVKAWLNESGLDLIRRHLNKSNSDLAIAINVGDQPGIRL